MQKTDRPRFVWGAVAAACGVALFQDFMGLEAYMDFCRLHWVDAWWPLWLFFMAIACWFVVVSSRP